MCSFVVVALNGLARVSLLLVLIVSPWIFGGVQTHVQCKLYLGIVVSLVLWIVAVLWGALTRQFTANRLPLIIAPLLGGLALGAYQLSDHQQYSAARSDDAPAAATALDSAPGMEITKASLIASLKSERTISRSLTRFTQQKLVFAITTFLLASQLFASKLSQLWLWGTFAINGSAIAFFGIVQQLSWNGRIFWTVPMKQGGLAFASFVNRNNAAGYLCVCLAGALGLMLASVASDRPVVPARIRRTSEKISLFERTNVQVSGFIQSVAHFSAVQLFSGTFVILIAISIVSSLSRGGSLALAAATFVTSFFASRSRGIAVFAYVGAAVLIGIGLISWTGLESRIGQRWKTFVTANAIAGDARWSHWRDSINVVRDFPWTGTGYGTYQFAYLPYQSDPKTSILRFYHADNQFVEWLVEGGFIGFSLVLMTLLLVLLTVAALWKTSRLHENCGYVALFALISSCVSAFFDYGPSMPANMLALAALFGAVAGRATVLAANKQIVTFQRLLTVPGIPSPLVVPVLGIPLLVGGFLGLQELEAASTPNSICQRLPDLDTPDSLKIEAVDDQITQLTKAMEKYPDDADAHQALAYLRIYKFRLEEFEIGKKNRPGAAASEIWRLTHPSSLYRLANGWQSSGQIERIETAIESPAVHAHLVPAYAELQKTQSCCALAPDVDRDLAMLAFIHDPQNCSGEYHLRRALLLAPSSPQTYYEIGALAYSARLTEFSFSCLRKSLEMNLIFLRPIHQLISESLTLEEELDQVLPESAELLLQLAALYPQRKERRQRHMLTNRALDLLTNPREGLEEGERRHSLAMARVFLGEPEEAIAEYRRALALVPLQMTWRIEMIRLLNDTGHIRLAVHEAELAIAITPGHKALQALVRELQSKANGSVNEPISNFKSRKP